MLNPQGAITFSDIKAFGLSSSELARRLLDEAGVAVLAGNDFGPAAGLLTPLLQLP
jgi:aspartate/methionine/tyrosine aminotransferase